MAEEHNPFAPPTAKVELPAPAGDGFSGKLLPHHKAGRAIRLVALLAIVGFIAIGVAVTLPAFASGRAPSVVALLFTVVPLAISVGIFLTGSAVMRHEHWARVVGIIFGVLLLAGFPIGTIVGIYILWQLVFGWDKVAAQP